MAELSLNRRFPESYRHGTFVSKKSLTNRRALLTSIRSWERGSCGANGLQYGWKFHCNHFHEPCPRSESASETGTPVRHLTAPVPPARTGPPRPVSCSASETHERPSNTTFETLNTCARYFGPRLVAMNNGSLRAVECKSPEIHRNLCNGKLSFWGAHLPSAGCWKLTYA